MLILMGFLSHRCWKESQHHQHHWRCSLFYTWKFCQKYLFKSSWKFLEFGSVIWTNYWRHNWKYNWWYWLPNHHKNWPIYPWYWFIVKTYFCYGSVSNVCTFLLYSYLNILQNCRVCIKWQKILLMKFFL